MMMMESMTSRGTMMPRGMTWTMLYYLNDDDREHDHQRDDDDERSDDFDQTDPNIENLSCN